MFSTPSKISWCASFDERLQRCLKSLHRVMSKDTQKTQWTGEDCTFFPSTFTDPKLNYILRAIFEKAVERSRMNEIYCPRYPIPHEVDPQKPHPMSFPQSGEENIFLLQSTWGWGFLIASIWWKFVSTTEPPLLNSPQRQFAFWWVFVFSVNNANKLTPWFCFAIFTAPSEIVLEFSFLFLEIPM